MMRASEPTSSRLDNIEIKVAVEGLIPCRPNLARIALVAQQKAAVIASIIPNIDAPDYCLAEKISVTLVTCAA